MRKVLSCILLVAILVSVLGGCSKAPGEDPSGNGDLKDLKIGLVLDKVGTQPFLQSMVKSLEDGAAKHGYEAVIVECADNAAFEDNMRALVVEGADLIIGGGWTAGEAINKIAQESPDVKYALIDSMVEAENVKCISYVEQEGTYLVGMLAALITEEGENTFGMVNVNQGSGSWKWRYGYQEGLRAIKPDAKAIFNYVGSYNDPAKAKEFALQQHAQGATYIYGACAGGDPGVFEAALEKEFYTNGQDADYTTPDNPYIATSMLKDTYQTVKIIVEKFLNDEWDTENEVLGVKEGGIGAVYVTHDSETPRPENLTDEDIAKIKQAVEDMKAGKIDLRTIPTEEEYNK